MTSIAMYDRVVDKATHPVLRTPQCSRSNPSRIPDAAPMIITDPIISTTMKNKLKQENFLQTIVLDLLLIILNLVFKKLWVMKIFSQLCAYC